MTNLIKVSAVLVMWALPGLAFSQTTTSGGTASTTGGSNGGATTTGGSTGGVSASSGTSTTGGTGQLGIVCTTDQPVACGPANHAFCCSLNQPYCCPNYVCSADASCGSGGTTGGTTGNADAGGGSNGGSDGGPDAGNITQQSCPPAQPFACGGNLCCTQLAPVCCAAADGSLFCGVDDFCGQPIANANANDGYGPCCASSQASQGAGLAAYLLVVLGYTVLRRRRR